MWNSISLCLFQLFKELWRNRSRRLGEVSDTIPAGLLALMSAFAGLVAGLLSHPIDVLKTAIMTHEKGLPPDSYIDTAAYGTVDLWTHRLMSFVSGRSLFIPPLSSGLRERMLYLAAMSTITLGVYDSMLALLRKRKLPV
jgi:hypothetical protein